MKFHIFIRVFSYCNAAALTGRSYYIQFVYPRRRYALPWGWRHCVVALTGRTICFICLCINIIFLYSFTLMKSAFFIL